MATQTEDVEELLQRHSLLESIETQKARVEKFRKENDQLKLARDKSEKDTHEFVAYFQKEMEKKDDMIANLNDTLTRKELEFEHGSSASKQSYELQITELKTKSAAEAERLQIRLKIVEDELNVLTEFREMKTTLEQNLAEKDRSLEELHVKYGNEINTIERKFLEEKARIQKDMARHIEDIKRASQEEAQKGLDADTRKIVTDNRRMVFDRLHLNYARSNAVAFSGRRTPVPATNDGRAAKHQEQTSG